MEVNSKIEKLAAENQSILIPLWKDILAMEDVSEESNFFDLGGDSLQLMTLLFRISRETGIELEPGTLFDNPTISQLALFMAHIQQRLSGEECEGTIRCQA